MSLIDTLRSRLVNSLQTEIIFNDKGFTEEQINYLVSLVNQVSDNVKELAPGNQGELF